MRSLEERWKQEVTLSRIVILSNDGSYLKDIDVKVSVIMNRLATGSTTDELRTTFPKITEADIRACMLFTYLRIVKKS